MTKKPNKPSTVAKYNYTTIQPDLKNEAIDPHKQIFPRDSP